MVEVEPLQRCLRCLAYCAPGMACVGEHPEDNAEVPCRPAVTVPPFICRCGHPGAGCVCRGGY